MVLWANQVPSAFRAGLRTRGQAGVEGVLGGAQVAGAHGRIEPGQFCGLVQGYVLEVQEHGVDLAGGQQGVEGAVSGRRGAGLAQGLVLDAGARCRRSESAGVAGRAAAENTAPVGDQPCR